MGQVTKPSRLYWGGEAAVFEALSDAKQMRLVEHAGVVGYHAADVSRIRLWTFLWELPHLTFVLVANHM